MPTLLTSLLHDSVLSWHFCYVIKVFSMYKTTKYIEVIYRWYIRDVSLYKDYSLQKIYCKVLIVLNIKT